MAEDKDNRELTSGQELTRVRQESSTSWMYSEAHDFDLGLAWPRLGTPAHYSVSVNHSSMVLMSDGQPGAMTNSVRNLEIRTLPSWGVLSLPASDLA